MNASEWAQLRQKHEANEETLKLHRTCVEDFLTAAEKDELRLNHPLHETVLNEKKSLGFGIHYRIEHGLAGELFHCYHFSAEPGTGYWSVDKSGGD